jgi:serine/threonine-protein kinase
MAVVHQAYDSVLDRIVAVKLLRIDLAMDDVARERFAREAASVAPLNHPSIVSVFDTGEDETPSGPVPWMVMELVHGHTLRELLDRTGPLPWRRALAVTARVLDALEYSHDAQIVHRDIKPPNVMVAEDGAVKVMDFGIARTLDDGMPSITAAGRVMGTPHYFSPEQALGRPATPCSDLYSVGCLLYEILTGAPPFDDDDFMSVAQKHVREEPVRPSAKTRGIPGAVDDVVLHALRKDPRLRYGTAAQMREGIGRVLARTENGTRDELLAAGGPAGPAPSRHRSGGRARAKQPVRGSRRGRRAPRKAPSGRIALAAAGACVTVVALLFLLVR